MFTYGYVYNVYIVYIAQIAELGISELQRD